MGLFDTLKDWMRGPDVAPSRVVDLPDGPVDADTLLGLLSQVIDPELGIDIVSMGLIREITVEDGEARVNMTLSTPGCPVGPAILDEVREVIRAAGLRPEVELGFDPPWTPADMTLGARARLGR